ncbi:MAG: ABC transporter permease [bacterium]|nr:ABC transporter permease [bacterium]
MEMQNQQTPLERLGFDQSDADRLLAESLEFKGESLWTDARRRLKKNRVATWSMRFLILFALMSFFAPLLPLRQPAEQNLPNQLQPPSYTFGDSNYLPLVAPGADYDPVKMTNIHGSLTFVDHWLIQARLGIFGRWQTGHWMGTDAMGRDLMSRIVWGSRTSIKVALAATLCSLLIGVLYGAFSGLMGGRIDNLMMRMVDVLYSIPFIFVVIFLITVLKDQEEALAKYGIGRMTVFYIVIGAIYWLTMARVVRGQVLSLKNKEFIEATRVIGASVPRILLGHIVPNVLSIVIIYLTLTIPAVMLFEAFLSFLGLGIEAPEVSWGTLASDSTKAINPIRIFWWLVLFPSLAMGSTLLALNMLGDGLRDAMDPKMRGKD